MQARTESDSPWLFWLIGKLREQFARLIQQELQLAKRELQENLAKLLRDSATLIIAGFTAYAGLIVLLIGLGFLLANVFVNLGWATPIAYGSGLGIIGFFIAIVSAILISKAVRTLSNESLAPKKTLQSVDEIAGTRLSVAAAPKKKSHLDSEKPSSNEIEEHIHPTGRPGSPVADKSKRARNQLQNRPITALALALWAGLLAGSFLTKSRGK